ncbi:hypothetical protein NST67_15065 [Bacillus sp. FSL W7-1321]
MTFPTAYSLELEKPITAEEANQLSFIGKLTDARAFRCNGHKDCKVPITCANFNTSKKERKKNPYFTKGTGNSVTHHKDCGHISKSKKSSKRKQDTKTQVRQTSKLVLKLGANGFMKPNPSTETKSNGQPESKSVSSTTLQNSDKKKAMRNVKTHVTTLRSLVQKYKSGEYDLDEKIFNLPGPTSFNELFYSLDTPSILNYKFQVYFGLARIYEIEKGKNFYIVEFITEHTYVDEDEDIKDTPSFSVSKYHVENHYSWIKNYLNSNKTFTCFISWFPAIQKYGKKYINFKKVTPENYFFQT